MEGTAPEQGEGRPNFKNRSNESLSKLTNADGSLKEGVPTVYEEEINNEVQSRQAKKESDTDNIRTQNNIIKRINAEVEKEFGDGKHNMINTREEMKRYDPTLYNILARYFPATDQPISRHKKVNLYDWK